MSFAPVALSEITKLAQQRWFELTVGVTSITRTTSTLRRFSRRVIVAAVVVVQLLLIVVAYDSDHKTFGFQMFPESSRWEAEIVRVQSDGTRVPVNEDWDYRWSELVQGRGLTNPFDNHHADSGLRNQFGYFQGSLDWVAENTPEDTSTVFLEAEVTFTDNGRGPFTRIFTSTERQVGADQ